MAQNGPDKFIGKLAARHGVAALVGRILSVATGSAGIVVFARLMSAEDFATFSVVQTIISLASTVAAFGLGQTALITLGAVDKTCKAAVSRVLRNIATIGFYSHMITGVVSLLLFSVGGTWIVGSSIPFAVALLLSFSVILRGIQNVYSEIARALNLTFVANLLTGANGGAIHNLFLLVAMIVVSTRSAVDWVVAVTVGLAALLASIPLILFLQNLESQSVKKTTVYGCKDKSSDHNAAPISVESNWFVSGMFALLCLAIMICDQIDILMVGSMGNQTSASFYVAAKRVAVLFSIPGSISAMAMASLIPELYSAGKTKELNKLTRIASALASVPSFLLIAVVAFFPFTVVEMLLGASYRDAAPLLWILAPCQLAATCMGPFDLVLFSVGGQKISLLLYVLAALPVMIFGPAVCHHFGFVGFAVLVSIFVCIRNIFGCWLTFKMYGISTFPSFSSLLLIFRRDKRV